ncbi:glycine betaine transport ATP-binding protein [Planococcus antarcticus DSM 14505]|uniref:Carnitine transport ATP-binding protein OpuCA n=1 Tax=Planococcus antarcticus DSM 14505 TaxID=1185653 RepID=A0A1C7DDP1_9BACL|nr:ABC transporter ATP-binding protein [Planococcus antarcticus]ANU09639.1 glycine/betaine ABC transporter ATP-binding protein [Planococcus antarcticus DSM 14505]EIM05348.1 glycine betaine transport ATP-binding protein [Planococcus antarcticus DSM 14505]
MISFNHVTKKYGEDITAINDVDFTVEQGKIVVLLGPSGCGKTTLLRMVNRLESISEGEIIIDNENSKDLNPIELRRKIGYVIQSNGLFPNMTIEENVMLVPDLLGWSKKDKRERFEYLMNLIGLDVKDYGKRFPHELSGGQQQRIGVVRALAADPPVMLMDEPFGALDPIIRDKIQEEFLQIQREVKKTILFVSHDIDEAIKMADKIVLLRDGEIMQFDTPSEMLAHPKNEFVSQFFGKDRAIKSLSLHTVENLREVIGLGPVDESVQDTKTINVHQDLRNTLSMLLNQEADQVIVKDDQGESIGTITIDLVQKYLHFEIKGKMSVSQEG